ncbi:Cu-binding protein [Coelomomyces lativittatus]|nr:Cu-binding protein [Coelomomyces lativittatus]KAJ1501031.1 Cu-binding protein [Coelomomyces lativittatus]
MHGLPVTEKTYQGNYQLMYFGFTHCPDICPEELEKMGTVFDLLNKELPEVVPMQGLFVTCDPVRDTPSMLKSYLTDFHPQLMGLTGTYEAIQSMAKQFRVYFSSPSTLPPHEYLVDHSIFIYFLDPLGQFIEAFGKNVSAQDIVLKMKHHFQTHPLSSSSSSSSSSSPLPKKEDGE